MSLFAGFCVILMRMRAQADLACLAIILYNEKERHVADDLVHRMVKRAVEMEGTVTGEHGVGVIKRDYLNHELGESTVDLMRKVRMLLRCYCSCRFYIR